MKFKHFKGDIYNVNLVSTPIAYNPFPEFGCKEATHTETLNKITIIISKGRAYHLEEECEDVLVLYFKNLDRLWARPYDNFMSPIDREGVEQKFRFEKITE